MHGVMVAAVPNVRLVEIALVTDAVIFSQDSSPKFLTASEPFR
jgi:hypothetical protein